MAVSRPRPGWKQLKKARRKKAFHRKRTGKPESQPYSLTRRRFGL